MPTAWQFVFASSRLSRCPRSGEVGRHHVHEAAVQRAVTTALRQLGWAKRVTCHTLRHSFATHLLEMGQDIGSLLELIDGEFQMTPPGEQEAITYRCPLKKDRMELLRDALPVLFDELTSSPARELRPRININTAPREVLMTLPGLTEADVQGILDHRPGPDADSASASRFRTPAWLITEAGFALDTVRNLEPHITTRSQVFRVQVLGYSAGGGPASRIEAVVDTNAGRPRILYWRDLTELGDSFLLHRTGSPKR